MSEIVGWEWTRPGVMWMLLLAVPWLVWYHFRSLSDFPRWQRMLSLLLRTAVVIALLLSLAGLVLLTTTKRQMLIVTVDRSESIDEAAKEVADSFAQELITAAAGNEQVSLRFVPFDLTPGDDTDSWPPAESPPDSKPQQPAPVTATAPEDEDPELPDPPPAEQQEETLPGTDIATAIRTAVASIPPSYVPKVVLISDGNATTGDAVAAAAAGGVPIDTKPLPQRSEPEVQLASVSAPAQVRQGEPFFVEITVNSTGDGKGYVDLYRGDVSIGGEEPKPVDIKAGENKFRVRQSVTGQRQVTFAARLRGFGDADTLLDNNESSALVCRRRASASLADRSRYRSDRFASLGIGRTKN